MFRKIMAYAFLLALTSTCSADSELKQAWKEVTAEYGEWGSGFKHERVGQICDTYREWGEGEAALDTWPGCTVVFIADPEDDYDLGTVAEGEQDNFLNTQHYNQAWNLHGKGFLGNSLPRAPQDLDPVCLIANVDGRIVLGYEEGEGDKLLPCPGHDEGVPFTEEMVLEGLNGTRNLEDMCSKCYQAVCTGERSVRARDCGSSNDGGVDLEEEATFIKQAQPVYHCHLTMANEGACDYVQYVQHEASRDYYMDYSVLCGWENIRYLNITFCDCTKVAGTNNGCRRDEATEMAYAGVVCGNCDGVGFNEDRAFESIFSPLNDKDPYDGQCAKYRVTTDEGWGKNYSKMMCSKGIWCPDGYNGGDNCKFHCDNYGKVSEVYFDTECGDYPDFPTELCTETKCFFAPQGEKASWEEAEAHCTELGGHLASILSQDENDIVDRLAKNVGQSSVWIGFNDIVSEGTFVWSDGHEAVFTSWSNNEPNNFKDTEDCGELHMGGSWNDIDCTSAFAYVCSAAQSLGSERRLLGVADAVSAPLDITLDTRFDWGHVISDVKATGYKRRM